ncbi:hypothetical protein [Hyphococcus sp.]|uniref:hypothetical protein n=1 Tax=Hyphococcus sp. TaxID=2038636 RepID=UPI0020855DE8|nr:MAG: hypothetical protein DHS20C04_26080 [Marinicaulis sp.]
MTLNDVYLVSQIAAAVLVAPTILYLALQVRQNTVQMRAAARFHWVEASGQFNALVAGDKPTASMFRRGWENPDNLDDDERMQFIVHLGQFMQIYSTMYELHQDKLLPDTQWHNCRKDMIAVLSSPGGRYVWELFGKKGLDPAFVAYMDSLGDAGESSFDLMNL